MWRLDKVKIHEAGKSTKKLLAQERPEKIQAHKKEPILRTFSVDLVAIAGEGVEVAFLTIASRRVQIFRQQLVTKHLLMEERL